MQVWEETFNYYYGKEPRVDKELANAMTIDACFWSSVLSISSSSSTPCSSKRTGSKQYGDTHVPNTGTSWTMPSLSSMTRETYYTLKWCPVQNATLIIGWYTAKSPLPSSPSQEERSTNKETASAQTLWPKGKTQSQSHVGGKTSLCGSCRPEEQWKQMKARNEPSSSSSSNEPSLLLLSLLLLPSTGVIFLSTPTPNTPFPASSWYYHLHFVVLSGLLLLLLLLCY